MANHADFGFERTGIRHFYLFEMKTLKEARIEKGLKQETLSELTGITQATISQLETGKRRPYTCTKEVLENFLGPIDWTKTKINGSIH